MTVRDIFCSKLHFKAWFGPSKKRIFKLIRYSSWLFKINLRTFCTQIWPDCSLRTGLSRCGSCQEIELKKCFFRPKFERRYRICRSKTARSCMPCQRISILEASKNFEVQKLLSHPPNHRKNRIKGKLNNSKHFSMCGRRRKEESSARGESAKRDRRECDGNGCNNGIVFAIPSLISFDSFHAHLIKYARYL